MSKSFPRIDDSFLTDNEYIFKKYKPIKKIGRGNFGNIYLVINIKDLITFAMKTEKISAKLKTLESEAYYLFTLQGFGIPKLISYGHTKKYNILIETLLDKSLYYIFVKYRKKCSLVDMCLIAIQLLDRLEWIHSKDIIYRDVKPENFLIGSEDPNVIYVVDFGLCKKYRSSKTGKHLLPKLTGKFIGTLAYASQNVIRGKESSRRDDLISLGYVLIKLLKGYLPWPLDLKGKNKNKYFELLYLKETDGKGKLFENIPEELVDYIKYTKNLKFEQDPNYSYLRSLFIKIITKKSLNYKFLSLSWTDVKNNKKKLSGLPNNNSYRKSSSRYRLLQNIKEERIRRLHTESKKISNLKNISNYFSISNEKNCLTAESSDKYRKNYLIDDKNMINQIRINNLKSECNLKTINNNSSDIKKMIFKRNFNFLIYGNGNNIVKTIPLKKKLFLNNNENNITIFTHNNNGNKNQYFKNIRKRAIDQILTNKIIINNYNISNNIIDVSNKIKRTIQNIQLKNYNKYNNLFPYKIKKDLNLSNNIKYKRKFLIIDGKIIGASNIKENNRSYGNTPINKYKLLNRKINAYKLKNDEIQNRNIKQYLNNNYRLYGNKDDQNRINLTDN